MSKDHLVPTPIVDKNGKHTTVHKNASPAANTPAPVIPAPASQPAPTKTKEEYITLLTNRMNFWDDGLYMTARDTLEEYSEELIHRLVDTPDYGETWENISIMVGEGSSEAALNEYIAFAPHLTTKRLAMAQNALRALHTFPQLPQMDDYTKADPRIQAQCIAVLTLIDALEEEARVDLPAPVLPIWERRADKERRYQKSNSTADKDERELIDLLIEKPEHAKRITALVIERGTLNPALINDILTSETPALADGTL